MKKASKPTEASQPEQEEKIKTTLYIYKTLFEKIKYIAFMDDGYENQTDFINGHLDKAVKAWEVKHGEAVKK